MSSSVVSKAEDNKEIISGCLVTWQREPEFRDINKTQLAVFFKKYGYGPFYVKSIRETDESRLITISFEGGYAEIPDYYLQLVRSYSTSEEMKAADISAD